ncbi:MAG: D-sedoheptulose 7-phosphate isomerase [Cyclobacteriaceae bacterium]|nr:D-sedoheptulose 7-phosphate isomerase [Cyclobacteriaceae bacterium]UYN86019.1 MAG: D-sedoheptulose 7-phosphate isomerase [Cyclobacteriaceae bacterium]
MDNRHIITTELQQSATVLENFLNEPANYLKIDEAANAMIHAVNKGGKIIACGNGGSHCVAMHFAEELTGRYRENRNPIPALSISDPGHMSCVGNEYGYDFIFSRFVDAIGQPNDVLLAVSTSGNSANVIQAAQSAKAKGMKVIALTGKNGGKLASHADVEIRVPHFGFADRIHEIHYKIVHVLIVLLEKHV